MYPCYQDRIAADRRESFPIPWVVAENLLHLATWFVAGWLLFPMQVAVGQWPRWCGRPSSSSSRCC